MSAVPKKKLCWNCEGNVSKEIDNCPYCGVYVHAAELEEDSSWNPTYYPSKTEEIPSPLYQSQVIVENKEEQEEITEENSISFPWNALFGQLKEDVFPTLFLMMGSIFFLFGIVMILFSDKGSFTLQWQSHYGYYFLALSCPLVWFGWKFLQQLDKESE
jgi:hypothetical protein